MNTAGNQYLQALLGSELISERVKHELDHDGYTILASIIDSEWLQDIRKTFDEIVIAEGESIAIEHHKENKVTRIANLVNKGTVWEKIWCHPYLMSIGKYIFDNDFKISSLNGREALIQEGTNLYIQTGKKKEVIIQGSMFLTQFGLLMI